LRQKTCHMCGTCRLCSRDLRPVYSDTTQLNSTRRRVELSCVAINGPLRLNSVSLCPRFAFTDSLTFLRRRREFHRRRLLPLCPDSNYKFYRMFMFLLFFPFYFSLFSDGNLSVMERTLNVVSFHKRCFVVFISLNKT